MKNLTKTNYMIITTRSLKNSEAKAVYMSEDGKRYIKDGKRYTCIEGMACAEAMTDTQTFYNSIRAGQ